MSDDSGDSTAPVVQLDANSLWALSDILAPMILECVQRSFPVSQATVRDPPAAASQQPPSSFDFRNPDEWPRWKWRYIQFHLASGLSAKSDDRQVSTLLYCVGDDAEDTLVSTNISDADRKKYDEVIKKFDDFFQVQKNVIFEQARFNCHCQAARESVEQFITSLYTLAESCNYGELKDQMIHDRIVMGIHSESQSEQLQMDANLTLDKAKNLYNNVRLSRSSRPTEDRTKEGQTD